MINDFELFEAYFQKSKIYYIERLKRYNNGEKYSFNIYAFFFGMIWFIYRKMYIELMAIVGILVFEGFFEELILANTIGVTAGKIVSLFIIIATGGLIGGTANYFYLKKASRTVEIAKQTYINQDEQIAYLKKKGGVNLVLLISILIIIIVIFAYFFISNNSE